LLSVRRAGSQSHSGADANWLPARRGEARPLPASAWVAGVPQNKSLHETGLALTGAGRRRLWPDS
jgi:hypothetical protein